MIGPSGSVRMMVATRPVDFRNTKAVWSAPVHMADADGTTYGFPVILTGSRLRLACMVAGGVLRWWS